MSAAAGHVISRSRCPPQQLASPRSTRRARVMTAASAHGTQPHAGDARCDGVQGPRRHARPAAAGNCCGTLSPLPTPLLLPCRAVCPSCRLQEADPEDPWLQQEWGLLLAATGRPQEALVHLEVAGGHPREGSGRVGGVVWSWLRQAPCKAPCLPCCVSVCDGMTSSRRQRR